MLIGEIFALASALTIGMSAILSRFLTFKLPPIPIQAARGLIGGVILVLIIALMGDIGQYAIIPPHIIALSITAGICGIAIGDSIYIKTLSLAPASKVCPILWSLRILLVSIASSIFYDEKITWFVGIGAVLIVGGAYLALSAEEAPESRATAATSNLKKWLPLVLITGVLWASYYVILKYVLIQVAPIIDNSPMIINSINSTVAAVLLCLFLVFSGRGKSLKVYKAGKRTLWFLVTNGILCVIGMVTELYAIDIAGATRTSILVLWAPIFILIFSSIFLKEKITRRLVLGTLLCIGGTILLVVPSA
ncbi:DMT family transporter [Chloroflexota bacterium]